jgi:hypothetical protein
LGETFGAEVVVGEVEKHCEEEEAPVPFVIVPLGQRTAEEVLPRQ